MRLSKEVFSQVVRNAPLVALDLIIEKTDGSVLLGKRQNAPAKGYWFVPGGRIFKDENFRNAISRISISELSFDLLQLTSYELLGVYEHHYDRENVFNDPDFGTHYIVLALKFKPKNSCYFVPDSQNSQFEFLTPDVLLNMDEVHPFTKSYFQPLPINRL